jgi:hypothetical protein
VSIGTWCIISLPYELQYLKHTLLKKKWNSKGSVWEVTFFYYKEQLSVNLEVQLGIWMAWSQSLRELLLFSLTLCLENDQGQSSCFIPREVMRSVWLIPTMRCLQLKVGGNSDLVFSVVREAVSSDCNICFVGNQC